MWKNWTIQKRHWIKGLIGLLLPSILVIIFTELANGKKENDSRDDEMFQFVNEQKSPTTCSKNDKIVFSPTSPWLEEFLKTTYKESENIKFEAFGRKDALDKFLNDGQHRNRSESLFGIEFDDSMKVKCKFSYI